jgi:hypothetical protein
MLTDKVTMLRVRANWIAKQVKVIASTKPNSLTAMAYRQLAATDDVPLFAAFDTLQYLGYFTEEN